MTWMRYVLDGTSVEGDPCDSFRRIIHPIEDLSPSSVIIFFLTWRRLWNTSKGGVFALVNQWDTGKKITQYFSGDVLFLAICACLLELNFDLSFSIECGRLVWTGPGTNTLRRKRLT